MPPSVVEPVGVVLNHIQPALINKIIDEKIFQLRAKDDSIIDL